jgi:hypothetical protein
MATVRPEPDSPVTERRVVETAGRVELDRARARIIELERQLRATAAVPWAAKAMRWAILNALALLLLVACLAAGHRLLVWGWP